MNKDYKLMAMLIPIILILGGALYIFPDASGLKTDIATPLLEQTNNSSLNQTSNNSIVENQTNPINTQYSQVAANNNNYYSPTEPNDPGSSSDNSSNNDPTNPTEPDVPSNESNKFILINELL